MRIPSRAAAALVFLSALAHAHERGFHKRDVITVTRDETVVLVALDVDSGHRCAVLRQAADADGNGSLDALEKKALSDRLRKIAVEPLELRLSGYRLPLEVEEVKLDLRGDGRAGEGGLSVAVLLRFGHPRPVSAGARLELKDRSPDHSHVRVEVFEGSADAGTRWKHQELEGKATLSMVLQGPF